MHTTCRSASHPKVFVVDQMPEPYDRKSYGSPHPPSTARTSTAPPRGIYFQRSQLALYYSQFIALHEMVHVLPGRLDPHRNAHGIEEDLGDVLGSMWLSRIILGEDLTRRLFILNRLSSQYDPY
jgi:hypothetical protein